MANTAGTGSSFTGTASADIIVAEETGITGATTDTINGLAGNDVIFGDHDELFVDAGAGNATIGTAIDINDETLWSTKANPDVGDTSVPYTSVLATGANELDYFKVTVGAGQTVTVDLDYGFGPYGGPSFDSVVRLVDINGGELAYNDDSDITEGGRGSSPITGTLSRDSYFTFTNTGGLALNYFIEVGRFNGEGLPGDVVTSGATYMLNVSVTGHANTNIAAFSADIMRTDAFHYDGPRADLRAIAVVADGPMTQMIMKLYFGCFPQVSRTRLFTRESEARDWLRSQLLESGFTDN